MADIDFNFDDLYKLAKQLKNLNNKVKKDACLRECVSTLAQVYFAEVVKNTPVGEEKTVEVKTKQGIRIFRTNSEHMRRSWGMGEVEKIDGRYTVKVFNSASYASYVNDGHVQKPGRFVPILGKRLVKNYVAGLKMTDIAKKKTKRHSKELLEKIIRAYLDKGFKDG